MKTNVFFSKLRESNYFGTAYTVKALPNQQQIVCGSRTSASTSYSGRILFCARLYNGEVLWANTYAHSNVHTAISRSYSMLSASVDVTTNGDFYLAGRSERHVAVAKLTSTGSVTWSYRLSLVSSTQQIHVITTPDQGCIITSLLASANIFVAKFTPSGAKAWIYEINSEAVHSGCAALLTPNGQSLIIVGHTPDHVVGESRRPLALNLNASNGTVKWARIFPPEIDARDVTMSPEGKLLVVGAIQNDGKENGLLFKKNGVLFEMNPETGNITWAQTLSTTSEWELDLITATPHAFFLSSLFARKPRIVSTTPNGQVKNAILLEASSTAPARIYATALSEMGLLVSGEIGSLSTYPFMAHFAYNTTLALEGCDADMRPLTTSPTVVDMSFVTHPAEQLLTMRNITYIRAEERPLTIRRMQFPNNPRVCIANTTYLFPFTTQTETPITLPPIDTHSASMLSASQVASPSLFQKHVITENTDALHASRLPLDNTTNFQGFSIMLTSGAGSLGLMLGAGIGGACALLLALAAATYWARQRNKTMNHEHHVHAALGQSETWNGSLTVTETAPARTHAYADTSALDTDTTPIPQTQNTYDSLDVSGRIVVTSACNANPNGQYGDMPVNNTSSHYKALSQTPNDTPTIYENANFLAEQNAAFPTEQKESQYTTHTR